MLEILSPRALLPCPHKPFPPPALLDRLAAELAGDRARIPVTVRRHGGGGLTLSGGELYFPNGLELVKPLNR